MTVLCALAAHLFALTNVLKNHDNILMEGYGAGTASGRWFMGWIGDLIGEIWGNYNIPFYDGLIGIFILSFAAYIGVLIFDIQNITLCVLWCGIFVSFPAVTSMMFYIYTVPYYSVAILMVMLAVYCTDRYKFGWASAIILLTCSIGIYQAYFPLAAGLYVSVLFIRSLTGTYNVKQSIRYAFEYLGILAVSMAAYFICLKVRLRVQNIQLNTYKGIDQMGQINPAEIPDMIVRTYREFFGIPFIDYYQLAATKIVSWMLVILALCSMVMVIILFRDNGRLELRKKWPALVFAVVFPAAVNGITLMCYHSKIYTLMIMAGVLIYLIPILLISEIMKRRSVRWGYPVVCAALGIVLLNYIWQSNGNYTAMYYTNQQMYHYINSLVTQVKDTEGFHTDLEWAVIGDKEKDPLFDNPWADTPFWYGGNKKNLMNEYSRNRFFEQILGYQIPWADADAVKTLQKEDVVVDMPIYPDKGSIQIVDNYVVIKLKK